MSTLPIQLPDLAVELRRLLEQVPAGRVVTYGDLAEALGDRAAARWVGHWMLHHRHDEQCVCHRVVRHDGAIGRSISGDEDDKRRRLASEGVACRSGRVDLQRHRLATISLRGDRPLRELIAIQQQLAARAQTTHRRTMPTRVAGVDVSYKPLGIEQGDLAVAAYVVVDVSSRDIVFETTAARVARFPYVTGYLAFRELPVLLDVIDAARGQGETADVVLVDGSGMLHARHAGLATHLGVLADLPTIGVTKKLLCGTYDRSALRPGRPTAVEWQGGEIGSALQARTGTARPLFVSPGHQVDVAFATSIVVQTLHRRRLPEPLYWADRVSRRAVKASTADDDQA